MGGRHSAATADRRFPGGRGRGRGRGERGREAEGGAERRLRRRDEARRDLDHG